jgi:glycosyltransferase involved in cell wall biosynthesis
MVALSHGIPIVTTTGLLTEPVWEQWDAAVLVPAEDSAAVARAVAALIGNPARRQRLSRRAYAMYDEQFDLKHTIHALRSTA